jgi:hypothetical protein
MCNQDPKFNKSWLVPRSPIAEDRKEQELLLAEWVEYASHEGYYTDDWSARITTIVRGVPGGVTEEVCQTATSIVVWLATNIGKAFLWEVFPKMRNLPSYDNTQNEDIILAAWTRENRRNRGWRRLEAVLWANGTLQLATATDFEVAEAMMLWLSSTGGRTFITKAFQKYGWQTCWGIPHHLA